MAYTVAEAEVRVMPNADNFGELVKAEVLPQADNIGQEVGDRIAAKMRERIRVGLADLPDAKIGVDTTKASVEVDKFVAETKAKTDLAGTESGKSFGNNMASSAERSMNGRSGLIAAAIAGGILAGAPLVVAAAGTLVGAIAGVVAAQSPEVQQAAAHVGRVFSDEFGQAALIAVPWVKAALNEVADAASGMASTMAPAFASLQAPIHLLTDGLLALINNMLPGIVQATQRATPVFAGLGSLLGSIGSGLGSLFSTASEHANAAGQVFRSLGDTLRPLLASLGSLVGAGAELGTVILPPLAAALSAVAAVLEHTGPLVAAAAGAFLAMKAAALIQPLLASLAAGIERIGATSMVAVAELTGVEAAGVAAGTGFEAAAAGARGLEAALGPVGILLAALSVLFPVMVGAYQRADAAQKGTAASATALTTALRESNGAISANVRLAAAQEAQQQGVLSVMTSAGLGTTKVTDAILGQGNAYNEVMAELIGYRDAHTDMNGVRTKAAEDINKTVIPALVALHGEYATGSTDAQQLAVALGEVNGAAADNAARLQGISNAAQQAAGQVNLLKLDIQELTQKHVDLDTAEAAFTQAVDNTKTALQNTTGALIDANGQLDVHTQRGAAAQQALLSMRDASQQVIGTMEEQGYSTEQVTARSDEMRKSFIDQAKQMGFNDDQAHALADRYLGFPQDVHTKIVADTSLANLSLDQLENRLAQMRAAAPTVITIEERVAYARLNAGPALAGPDGGAIGGIAKFAEGGTLGSLFNPMAAGVAQIVPPNTFRVIGDRPVDDEAYIPINDSARSLAILSQTAGRMGFALAGLDGRSGGGSDGGPKSISLRLDGQAVTDLMDGRIVTFAQTATDRGSYSA